jgi:hypothetical protein
VDDALTRRFRRGSVVGMVVAAVLAIPVAPAFALSFGGTQRASASWAWNAGEGLAVSTHRLFSVWASDCPPPSAECATDASPRMGVFVQRGPQGATPMNWTKPRRMSPSTRHAERAAIAATGNVVVVGWVTQTRYVHYRPAAPRVFWIRVSRNEGDSWSDPIRMSPGGGRVDYPRLAASDGHVYAVWTNADNGAVRLARSGDAGRTWLRRTVGTTSAGERSPAGFAGLPDVGASGALVGVGWVANRAGKQVALTSDDYAIGLDAATAPTTLTDGSPHPGLRYPAVGGSADVGDPRVGFAYGMPGGIGVRVFGGHGLGDESAAVSWGFQAGGPVYAEGYGPAVLPAGGSTVLLAVAACRRNATLDDPCDAQAGARVDVVYTETDNDGNTWLAPRRLTDASLEPYRINDEPSLALTSGGVRRVAFDRYQRTFTAYLVAMRSGA